MDDGFIPNGVLIKWVWCGGVVGQNLKRLKKKKIYRQIKIHLIIQYEALELRAAEALMCHVSCSVTRYRGRTSVARIQPDPGFVLRWPATNDSCRIKPSLGLICIPESNAHDSVDARGLVRKLRCDMSDIIQPKHRDAMYPFQHSRSDKRTITFSFQSHNKRLA